MQNPDEPAIRRLERIRALLLGAAGVLVVVVILLIIVDF